jgi:hypothetical protein
MELEVSSKYHCNGEKCCANRINPVVFISECYSWHDANSGVPRWTMVISKFEFYYRIMFTQCLGNDVYFAAITTPDKWQAKQVSHPCI